MMKRYILPENLRDALLSYLRGQPYAQVAQGVRALESLEALDDTGKQAPKLEAITEK